MASPPKHADSLAGGSPVTSTASEGGGPMGVVERGGGGGGDVLSLHPNDMLQPLMSTLHNSRLTTNSANTKLTSLRRRNVWHHLCW